MGYFIGVAISLYFIKRHGINLPLGRLTLFYIKLLLLFALIVTPLWLLRASLPGGNLIQLITVTSLSVVLYLGISKLFKITEVTSLIKVIRSGR